MLQLLGSGLRTCDGVSRRELLTAGSATALGLTLPQLLRAEAVQGDDLKARVGKARSVVLLYLFG